MSFEHARKVADAVLYEGYVLYPYRASAAKNRMRFQFGVVVPPGSGDESAEPHARQAECLVEPNTEGVPVLSICLRFLQLQARSLAQQIGDGLATVDRLEIGDRVYLAWDEAVEHEFEHTIRLDSSVSCQSVPISIDGGRDEQPIAGADVTARIVRERWPISAMLHASVVTDSRWTKVRIRIENTAATPASGREDRERLRHSLLGVHLLLGIQNGAFVSLLEPPDDARIAAASCANDGMWPVLIGPQGEHEVMLASPIILYDYPQIAPESHGDFYDATEIDELLTLRVMTLTDDEKREARATDERSRMIVERADEMPVELREKLHGAIRYLGPTRETARAAEGANETILAEWIRSQDGADDLQSIEISGCRISRGSIVRLRPVRRADSMDMFLSGESGTVREILRDVEGRTYVGVTVGADPAADMHEWYGRYFYFYPEELQPTADQVPNATKEG